MREARPVVCTMMPSSLPASCVWEPTAAGQGRCRRGAPCRASTAASTAIRLISSRMPVNLVVTNVPGPPFALYLLPARVEQTFPFLPLFESQGLGIELFRYRDEPFIDLTGDWDLLARLEELASVVRPAL